MEAIDDGEQVGVVEGEEGLIVVDSRMFGVLWIGSHAVAVINPNPPAGGELQTAWHLQEGFSTLELYSPSILTLMG
ncbi:hypothetical protein NC652_030742 [Populus alba x Populus x berolinensis]|nr:hypothetical protein NC652_030742 [Populus alba x Populus x berolinensis]